MSRQKLAAALMAGLTLLYVFLLGQTGYLLLIDDEPIAKVIGGLIMVFPLFAAWAIFIELRFGLALEKLSRKIIEDGNLPEFDFELRPSGRPTRASADRVFEQHQTKAAENEINYLYWYGLGLIYDAAGDRTRARKAMRTAIALAKAQSLI